jgi:hypothetical protein
MQALELTVDTTVDESESQSLLELPSVAADAA